MRVAVVSALAALSLVSLSGCSGETTTATNITKTAATLQARVSWKKGERITWWFETRRDGSGSWVRDQLNGPLTMRNTANNQLITERVGGLREKTVYQYRLCSHFRDTSGKQHGSMKDPICVDREAGKPKRHWSEFKTGGGGGGPPFGLPLLKHLDKVGDWDSVLTEAPGSSITNQPDGSIRLYQPGDGERTELQVHRPEDGGVPSHGYEAYYTWEFKISPSTNLYKGHNTISQFHGNNNAGYTGGMVISEDRPPERLILRVKGGKQTSTSGSHRYEFESDRGEYAVPQSQLTTTAFQRGVWNKVEYHVLWTDKWNGFAWMRFNGGPWLGLDDVPTASNIADVQMFRVGWYPGSDSVPSGGLEMFVRNTAVYGKPAA